jgi:hypothetical protein
MRNPVSKRWLLAGGTAMLAIAAAQPAAAITINSGPSVLYANSNAGTCSIRIEVNATGTSNNDALDVAVTVNGAFVNNNQNGSNILLNNSWSLNNGQTAALQTSFLIPATFGRQPYATTVYDSQFGYTFTNPITTNPFDRAMMIAGGADCRALLPNAAPSANAGIDQNFNGGGNLVTLSGLSSFDPDGDALTYQWVQSIGPSVTLDNPASGTPSFTLPAQVNHQRIFEFVLIVTDAVGVSSVADEVRVIQAAGPNTPPNADAGADATITPGATIALTGIGTDVDNDPLTYAWTQVSGTPVSISNANSANASFVAPASNGNTQPLIFQLTVSDGAATAQDSITLTVPANAPPTVNAGPDQTRTAGSAVTLAGSATDPEGNPLTYQWTQTAGPSVTLTGATTLTPSFTAPPKTAVAQVLTFSLVAHDGTSSSAPDTVDVTIPANAGPVANAGQDVTVNGGVQVTLSGSSSMDGDGDSLTFTWTQTSGPPVALSNANAANPTFTAPPGGQAVQTITFDLVVSDGIVAASDSVTISVNPNAAPVANAGVDQGPINTGQTVTLDGTGSADPDNNPLTYQWTQVSGPTVTLSSATAARPTFVAPNVQGTQNLVFQLVVNDGSVDSQPDTVTIAVRAVGTITVVQRVVGADGTFSFTSDVTALGGTVVTTNGTGQRTATLVAAGPHTLTAGDARANGYAVTSISCNDTDSVVNLAGRSVAIALSPNENLICTFTSTNTRDAATVAIRNFLTARNAAILSSQPDLQRRLDRLNGAPASGGSVSAYGVPIPGSGNLPLQLTLGRGQTRASASLGMANSALGRGSNGASLDIWAEGFVSSLSYAGHRGQFSLFYVGADYRVSGNLLIGGLVQFDRFSHRGGMTQGAVEGKGWMVGPYATVRLAPRLYADFRAAWGTSDNQVSPLGTFVDGFDTRRAFYSGSLIGDFDLGTRTGIRPEITVRYLDERQKGYVDTLGVTIPGQQVGQGDISFRPRVYHVVDLGGSWTLRPFAEGEGIYTFGLDPASVLGSDFRMRIEGGAELIYTGRMRFGVSGFHDGIGGSGSYENSGVHVTLSIGM